MLNLNYGFSHCKEYIDRDGVKKEVVRVIIPLKVIEGMDKEGNRTFTIRSGCSFFNSCYNPDCWFSAAAKANREEKREKDSSNARFRF